MIAPISGLSAIAGRYDGFVLDLWGVIHDGVTAYPGVAETLAALRRAGKRTIMLSNAPRRATALIEQLTRLGIERGLYDEVMSSGEAVHLEMERRTDPVFAALGANLYHLGPERDCNVYESLPYRSVDLEQADFVLNTGPVEVTESVADYQSILDRALARRLPMVSANPDHVVIRQGKRITCAGAIADRYADMGGQVVQRGKPDPAIYAVALATLGIADRSRVCAVGDALHTDIRGARAGGIDAVLVTGGIHADELGIKWGETADPARLAELARHHGETPVAAIPKFVW
ncbi:TIGR01459 family HAD-type hydrolase [Magnetospirillum sp. 15-1]|uniref:TIGR01459 family HAD-type hydrolase n=1 Tax=Magnetospirillum sp. 15-1 TaxID=1979370 RepID=UPI000BBBB0CA|nr:TIGR01459 family HAD-type hydrolase [Magnetospirillum sp. 15-1]